jgi:hypothetical protein
MTETTNSLRTEAPGRGRKRPTLPGFERVDGEWRLRLDRYESLIEAVAAVDVSDGVSQTEMKLVQTRLEGYVGTHKRDDHAGDLGQYSGVDSVATVQELARFFRVLVANRVERPPDDR